MKKHNRITVRAAALAMALASVLSFSSCFHDNWNIPERTEQDFDFGAILGGLVTTTPATTGEIKDKEYLPGGVILTLSEDGGHYIVSGTDNTSAEKISIPESYNGVPIEEIAEGAFAGISSLEVISIPLSIKNIGARAFKDCSSLEYTEYGGAKYLGNEDNPYIALIESGVNNTEEIKIHQKTKVVAAEAFYDNEMITSLSVSDSVVTIGKMAFKDCPNLTRVDIGNGVELIGEEAFLRAKKLAQLSLGSSVVKIGDSAFKNNSVLRAVEIPDSVTEIGTYAFHSCSILTNLTIGNGVKIIAEKAFASCPVLTNVKFGNSVEYIGNAAFSDCIWLENVSLPSTIETVFSSAFSGCQKLNYSTYSSGQYLGNTENPYEYLITHSGAAAHVLRIHPDTRRIAATLISTLDSTYSIYSLEIQDGAKYLHVNDKCLIDTKEKKLLAGIAGATIPDDGSVTSIADYAFYGIGGLRLSRIPESVTDIGDYAFYRCPGLASINILGAKHIGEGAFHRCVGIMSISIESALESIGENAFVGCTSLAEIDIPDSVTYLGEGAFQGCSKLSLVSLGAGIEHIPAATFKNCSALIKLTHKSTLVTIGDEAFSSCKGLESFDFNEGLEYIGAKAFLWCFALKNIILPHSLTEIGKEAFTSCQAIESLTLGSGISVICEGAFDGFGIDKIEYNGTLKEWKKVSFGKQNRTYAIIFKDGSSIVIPALD